MDSERNNEMDENQELVIVDDQDASENANSKGNNTSNQMDSLAPDDLINNDESNPEKLKSDPNLEDSLDEGEIVDDDDIASQPVKTESIKDEMDENKMPVDNISEDESLLQDENKKENQNDENWSNYSDWSESEDDLLKADMTGKDNKSEPMDNDTEIPKIVKEDDLEAISDDDFEAFTGDLDKLINKDSYQTTIEKETKEISIMETLNIDWKSLVQNNDKESIKEEDKKARRERLKEQNSTIRMLNRIGFSHQFAGPKLTELITEHLKEKLSDKYQPMLNPVPLLHSYHLNKKNHNDNILGTSNNYIMNGDKDPLFQNFVNYPFL